MHGPIDSLLTTADLAGCAELTIGEARITPATRTVSGPGGAVQVEPRVMQVLVTLAEAEGGVVTRDLLFARCWGGVFVGDDSLNRAIAGVRKVASTIGGGSFEVETVPRTGYRLSGAVRWISPEGETAQDDETKSHRFSRRAVIGAAIASAAAGGLAFWTMRKDVDPSAALMEESRLALRSGTPEGETRAIALLEKAVSTSPANAETWGLLALTRARIDEHGSSDNRVGLEQVESAARRALRLDPRNADAQAAMVLAIPYFGDWLAAERRFDQYLNLHPKHVETQDSRAFFLGAVGRMQQSARDRFALVAPKEKDAGLQFREAYCHWFLNRIPEADRTAEQGLAMWPRHGGLWFARLWILSGTGRFDQALAHLANADARPKLPPPMIASIGASLTAAKSRDPALVALASKQVMAGAARSVTGVVSAMMLLNLMQATDQAFALAQAYYLERGPILAAMSWRPGRPAVPDQRRRKTNMLFTPVGSAMRNDPRFMPMMEEMGLAEYWRRSGNPPDFLSGASA